MKKPPLPPHLQNKCYHCMTNEDEKKELSEIRDKWRAEIINNKWYNKICKIIKSFL